MLRAALCTGIVVGLATPRLFEARAFAQVTAWGANGFGEGNASPTIGTIVQLAAGGSHSAALTRHGGLAMWGANFHGQCDVPATARVIAVALGSGHTVALEESGLGTVRCWGNNWFGQCNAPQWIGTVVAIGAGHHHSMAVTADGHVHAWGLSQPSSVPKAVQGRVVAVDGGAEHSLALLDDGTVAAWGANHSGQSAVPMDLPGSMAVAAGAYFSLALTNEGTVRAWGSNSYLQCHVPWNAMDVTRIDAGDEHAVALRADGSVIAWGRNDVGQANVPWMQQPQGLVAAGGRHCMSAIAVAPPAGPWDERWVAPIGGAGLPTIQQVIDTTPSDRRLRIMLIPGTYRGTGHAVALAVDRTIEFVGPYGPDVTVIDGEGARRGILHLGTDQMSLSVRGITFTRCSGRPTGSPLHVSADGGAIRSSHGSGFVVEDCRFLDCKAAEEPLVFPYQGSGILFTGPYQGIGEDAPVPAPQPIRVSRCTFERCEHGAATIVGWRPLIEQSTFRDCRLGLGPAVFATGITLQSCAFESNHGTIFAGAVCLWYGTRPSLVSDCSFIGNSGPYGGGLFVTRTLGAEEPVTRTRIVGTTFSGNWSTYGSAGPSGGGGGAIYTGPCTDIEDCVLTGNTGLYGRAIKSASWWHSGLPRISGSAFDTCCPAWPIDAVTWGKDNEFDERCVDCAGDIECDGLVDGVDLGIMLSRWGPAVKGDVADINLDGAVDGVDLGLLLATWGVCPQG